MNELQVSSVGDQTIIAVDSEGVEFSVKIDDATLARLKRSASDTPERKVSPRDIQAHLRSGLSLAEVSALTGATAEQVERYAAPILAERDYVITTAQTLPAFGHVDNTHDNTTFGDLISQRLELVDARDVVWTAWKEDSGQWVVKVLFTTSGAERDARWFVDTKRQTVVPKNEEATRLSHAGTFDTSTLVPSLRAVGPSVSVSSQSDNESSSGTLNAETQELPLFMEPPEATEVTASNNTEDLLEALRRRRRESDGAPAWLRDDVSARTAPVEEIFQDSLDVPSGLLDSSEIQDHDSGTVFPLNTGSHKRNRPAMPTWDDIVSETKSDDDLL